MVGLQWIKCASAQSVDWRWPSSYCLHPCYSCTIDWAEPLSLFLVSSASNLFEAIRIVSVLVRPDPRPRAIVHHQRNYQLWSEYWCSLQHGSEHGLDPKLASIIRHFIKVATVGTNPTQPWERSKHRITAILSSIFIESATVPLKPFQYYSLFMRMFNKNPFLFNIFPLARSLFGSRFYLKTGKVKAWKIQVEVNENWKTSTQWGYWGTSHVSRELH